MIPMKEERQDNHVGSVLTWDAQLVYRLAQSLTVESVLSVYVD